MPRVLPSVERGRCADCGASRVRFYRDTECGGVHNCHLCDRCARVGEWSRDDAIEQAASDPAIQEAS